MFQSLMFWPLLPQLVLINIWVALFLSPSLGLGKSALGRQQPKAETGFDCVRCTPIVRASSIHHTTDPFSKLSKLQNVFVQVKIYYFPSEKCIFHHWNMYFFQIWKTCIWSWLHAASTVSTSFVLPTNPWILLANSGLSSKVSPPFQVFQREGLFILAFLVAIFGGWFYRNQVWWNHDFYWTFLLTSATGLFGVLA